MPNRLVSAIIVVLLLTSYLGITQNNEDIQSLKPIDVNEFSPSDSDFDFLIHRPGDSLTSPEVLTWSPNNYTEFSTMQYSITFEQITDTYDLQRIDITGFFIGPDLQLFEQFSVITTDFSVEESAEISTITQNYTYPNTIWSGNYSIVVDLTYTNGAIASAERNDVKVTNQSYYFGTRNSNEPITLCSCEAKVIDIHLLNSGEVETEFSHSIDIGNSAQNARIEWANESEELSIGTLAAGEEIILQIKVLIPTSSSDRDEMFKIPFEVEIYYENDNGDRIYIARDNVILEGMIVLENVYPSANLTFNDFNYTLEFTAGEDAEIPAQKIPDLFTYNRDYFLFNLSVINLGYYDRILNLEPTNLEFDYRVLMDGQNQTIAEFSAYKTLVYSLEQVNLKILVENLGNFDSATIGFDINFNESYTSLVSFDLAPHPNITGQVFSQASEYTDSFELPITHTIPLSIDLSEYEQYLFFNNQWLLTCTVPSGVTITLSSFSDECSNGPIVVTYNPTSSAMLDNTLTVFASATYSQNNITVDFALTPLLSVQTTNALHTLTLQIPIMIDNTTDDQHGGDDNNETDVDEPDGEVVESPTNSTNNENQTADNENETETAVDIDRDGDGIIDALDICPDSEANVAVDASGCKIVEQEVNTDESTDGNIQQNIEETASKSSDDNTFVYVVIGAIAIIVVGVIIAVVSKRSNKAATTVTKSIEAIAPLPAIPLPNLEPVVLQQWTDANGYSWRQMSDRTIMWWNGSEWIPYGKN